MNFFNISSDRDLRFFYLTVERKFCFKMKEIFKKNLIIHHKIDIYRFNSLVQMINELPM